MGRQPARHVGRFLARKVLIGPSKIEDTRRPTLAAAPGVIGDDGVDERFEHRDREQICRCRIEGQIGMAVVVEKVVEGDDLGPSHCRVERSIAKLRANTVDRSQTERLGLVECEAGVH